MKKIYFLFKISFLVIISIIYIYFILFTKYVPDVYVFIQYAIKDSVNRVVDINSIISNNFLFDLMILFGDLLGLTDFIGWISLIITLSLIFLIIKYSTLIYTGRFFGVLIVYFASFFVDLNQLRFNFGILFLFFSFYTTHNYLKKIFKALSFFSHLIPFSLYLVTFARLNFRKFILFIIPILILLLSTGVLLLFSDSRLLSYTSTDASAKYPKTLILFFPVLYYLMTTKISNYFFLKIKDFTYTVLTLGGVLFFFNFELSARFFEVAFIQITILNIYYKKNLTFDLLLFFLSLGVLSSRLLNGISNSSNFIDVYQ